MEMGCDVKKKYNVFLDLVGKKGVFRKKEVRGRRGFSIFRGHEEETPG